MTKREAQQIENAVAARLIQQYCEQLYRELGSMAAVRELLAGIHKHSLAWHVDHNTACAVRMTVTIEVDSKAQAIADVAAANKAWGNG